MADNDSIRSQRHRLHTNGDHSICRPESCNEARATFDKEREFFAQSAPVPILENTFGPRGTRLYKGFAIYGVLGPSITELLIEACHLVDRLDKLDKYLKNHTDWLTVSCERDESEHTIIVDKALSEARSQQLALRGVMAEIRQQLAARPAPKENEGEKPAKPVGIAGIRDDIAAWRGQTAS